MKRWKTRTAGSVRTSKTKAGADTLTIVAMAFAAAAAIGLLTPDQSATALEMTGSLTALVQNAITGIFTAIALAGQLFRYLRLSIEGKDR